jgi:hypothetical protein
MANNNSKNARKSADLLPAFFRTNKNTKFLSSTLDQLIKVPSLERIDGFVGSKITGNYNPLTDVYIPEAVSIREKYQFEPAVVVRNVDNSIKAAYGFDDLINQISYYGGNVDNLNRLIRPKINSYDPHIDWDKFINFSQYYWLPTGPDAVTIAGLQKNAVSTYTVTDSADGNFFVFTPDGLTPDPLLTFYRGITYVFNVDSKHKLYFKTEPVDGTGSQYTRGVTGNGTKKGQIIITVDSQTPSVLFYAASDNQLAGGRILVKSIVENSSINVEKEILGKVQYKSGNGVEFINGLKVRFVGNVTPSSYADNEYIVEGIGSGIRLIDYSNLTTPINVNSTIDVNFDETPFDEYPFDNFQSIPETPEYITINRASKDLNPWSRYNRWVHVDVITASAAANKVTPVYPATKQAKRPIIEFHPDIQLWNFGTTAIDTVDLIDEVTTDAFSIVEGAYGYYVDGVQLEDGMKVIFNADPDPLVQGQIYEVGIATFKGKQKLRLTLLLSPAVGDAVVIKNGNNYNGTSWWFNGTAWINGQQRNGTNQAPLFDLFDSVGHGYSDTTYYNSDFRGNKVFGYAIGSGAADSILGFPLQYISESVNTVGTYLFNNYLNSESITLTGTTTSIPTVEAYLRINNSTPRYINAWTTGATYNLPVEQFQVITSVQSSIEVTVFDNPTAITDLTISVFVGNNKVLQGTDYTLTTTGKRLSVTFTKSLNGTTTPVQVLFKCYTSASPNSTGVYETPINLTNNPLNGFIKSFTLSELSDHVKSMVDRDPEFVGSFPGASNLKSLPYITQYGSRLISNQNPLTFAQLFITDPEHNAINAIRKASTDYYQFRLNLIKFISQVGNLDQLSAVLDQALSAMGANKNSSFPYAHSDMLGYGENNITGTYTVTDPRNVNYSISNIFSATTLSDRSVLVYLTSNGKTRQLVYGVDYDFPLYDASVHILTGLTIGDTLTIKDYISTVGSYIPPTPTKLGLYPKYEPAIYIDNSYASGPQKVIQGHDGSLTVAFSEYDQADDYRDLALLEYERRIYNNLKVSYDSDLLDIHDLLPSVFRTSEYNYAEIYNLVQGDFLTWASAYGIDFASNNTYDVNNHKTYNYKSVSDLVFGNALPGGWRAIYKLYFDTDRPNTHPWEMLGITVKPTWWDAEYGAAPYTAGNLNLWQDLEAGITRYPSGTVIDPTYARPGLSQVIPVDDSGNVIDVREWAGIAKNDSISNIEQDWAFGDHGPAETAWRRSTLWPFAMQIIMALSKPADYAAMMFDTSRMVKDVTGQYNYGIGETFLNPKDLLLYSDTDSNGNTILAAGYGVWVIENGAQRSATYLTTLKNDLASVKLNLFYKAGGFLSKDKLEITIDSISPNTINPGVLLPNEDYTLHFNVSAPVKSAAISGIIVEKKNAQFAIRGYDKRYPYFVINQPMHQSTGGALTVGGKSEPFLIWKETSFYQTGQVVLYSNVYFRVLSSHNSGLTFTPSYYAAIKELTTVGGASVLVSNQFEKEEIIVPYNTRYDTIQEVYDLIVGYGHWLGTQGFLFDEYNKDLSQVVDWNFTGKEFLYWTTQNWANGAVITLSPFADTIKYQFTEAVVDNVLNSFYEYSLLKADGQVFPASNFSLSREDGVCSIATKNTTDGMFFARLNLVQKEHAIVLNNKSMFSDIIYDTETGYRQLRMKLAGFRTADWDGEFLSPGFVYDDAQIENWTQYTDYQVADIVKYVGNYYSATGNIAGTDSFNFNDWNLLGEKPVAQLLPNFDYKINQFEDFYSLDIDNFDLAQQRMAQHLIGYTPRTYLDNIFVNPIAQYKFYQGFIREKGTRNAIDKLAKASIHNLQGQIEYKEEWAFRIGHYGNFISYNELEFPLREGDFRENSQIVKFVDTAPILPNDIISYITPGDITIQGDMYSPDSAFTTTNSTYVNNDLIMPVAGYVRTDDVTATAYNKNSLVDIANNGNIQDGDTIWLGFREDGQWDVYRYTIQRPKVINSTVSLPGFSLTFTTDKFHNLSVGEVLSIYGTDNGTDGVYIITDIPTLTSFSVSTTLSSVDALTKHALIFKFVSVRTAVFDDIANLQNLITFQPGDLVWVDSNTLDGTGKWTVYQKAINYNTSTEYIVPTINRKFSAGIGTRVATQDNADIVVVSAPNYLSDINGYGRIFVYGIVDNVLSLITNYGLNDAYTLDLVSHTDRTNFGAALAYDTASNSIFAGAPGVNFVKISEIVNNTEIGTIREGSTLTNSVQLSEFGSSLFVSKTTATNKLLVVGAPGLNSSVGGVYAYNLAITSSTITASIPTLLTPANSQNDRAGTSIGGTADGTTIVVSAPNSGNKGAVYVYSTATTGTTTFNLTQTITPPNVCKANDKFGSTVLMSDDGTYLFAASTFVNDGKTNLGKVFIYKQNSSSQYVLNQTLDNPSMDSNLNFGQDIAIDSIGQMLTISGHGDNNFAGMIFDSDTTTIDNGTCHFGDTAKGSGAVYIFDRYNDKFIYAEELFDANVLNSDPVTGIPVADSQYGQSIAINNGTVVVGAPGKKVSGNTIGSIYVFAKQDYTVNSWNAHRVQNDLIDISKIKRAITIDTLNQKTLDYLDIIDPAKGRIPGIADQELRYKTAFDPAVYNIGVQGVVVNTHASWIEEHLGELWWDLSTVKYVWYEQSDIEYRKNAWGSLFAGASIDVYEWVSSEYLPSQWATLADTVEGLSKGISGQPKYADNSVLSVKQYYNSTTGGTTNVYFYWVKNTVIVPNIDSRRISANDVASIIYSPAAYGTKYISVISPDTITVTNVMDTLAQNTVYLNIAKDEIDNPVNQHTEWMLIADGDANSMPTALLDKKLMDSLLGHDSLGNPVPDPNLSERVKYGIGIRPRQGLFKDRIGALRNAIEYTNTILLQNIVTDVIDFSKLNAKDSIPDILLGTYDQQVDNEEGLYAITTGNFATAEISCQIVNGRISEVIIDKPGYGYLISPIVNVVTIDNSDSGAIIKTVIDSFGKVTGVSIVNPGSGLIAVPTLTVRPYTVIVTTDANSGNRWAKYQWAQSRWNKIYTQSFDTTLFWDYVNWKATAYDPLKPLVTTVDQPYLLATLNLATGDYVKVMNQGNGTYIILKKVDANGTFDNDYDLIYSEKGTIQFNTVLWNTSNSPYNFDNLYTYDSTLFDEGSERELEQILLAIKEDIFIGPLKVYWNKFFFKAVRYAMSEQIFLDWAFKTSFINVSNMAGPLDQRPVFKFQNSQYYEDYLNEVKPYHTKIRNFQVVYDIVEPTQSYTTDFDLPAKYDTDTDKFIPIELDDNSLNSYPRKGWADNYKLTVGSIIVADGGKGYTFAPTVQIIPAAGDVITDPATAIAYISIGKVIEVEVTHAGSGYTEIPTVVFTGGGPTDVVQARAYAQLINGKVRANTIGMRFDRISKTREIGDKQYIDQFFCDGSVSQFPLTWSAEDRKSSINITLDGIKVFDVDYSIHTYTSISNGYHKLYSTLILTYVPPRGKILEITYTKNINLYHAADRVEDYYAPTDGMPGLDTAQVMSGMVYPGTDIQTLPFAYTSNWDMLPFTASLWDDNGNGERALDAIIDGGNLSMVLGVNPDDIILDGDQFLSPNVSYGPEELVPGEVAESVAMSVYTRVAAGSPMIAQSTVLVDSTITSTTAQLTMLPPNTSAVMATFNRGILNYGTDYTIDFNNSTITVSTQTTTGILAITVVGVGGTAFAASDSTTSDAANITAQVGVPLANIGSLYVTLNGEAITSSQYKLTTKGVTVNGLTGTNTLQVWVFESPYKGYSEVKEQIFVTSTATNSYTLTQYPGVLGPVNAQAIVELNKKRLIPPHTAYYSAVAGQLVYEIDPSGEYPPGVFDLTVIQVFVNGIQISNQYDFILDQIGKRIIFLEGFLKVGDAIAITNVLYSDYSFANGMIYLNTKRITVPDNGILKVITFTNSDADMIRKEVFTAGSLRRYTMSRALLNDAYVWVSIGGIPLVNSEEYYVDADNVTVVIDDNYPINPTDIVVITSMTDVADTTVIAYRVFKDLLNRTTYRRLSEVDSTRLTAPLYTTSTEIHVANSSVLPTPHPAKNAPGVILIAGERIEYMAVNGNTLTRIKRATLGTGPKDVYPVGTWVTDQAPRQSLPFTETMNVNTATVVDPAITSYVINDMGIKTGSRVTVAFDNTTTNFKDLVKVYYAGIPLRKDPMYLHNPTVEFDISTTNIVGSTATTDLLPYAAVKGTAYIVTATNQVWVYTDSLEINAVNGYVYQGLNYLPPQFTITTSTTPNVYVLNLAVGLLTTSTTITLVQQTTKDWYDSPTSSLLDDNGVVATFLRDRQGMLPDKYHYGQS